MFVYRIIPYKDSAEPGKPFSPQYLHPIQGAGRIDNPNDYQVWYVTREPQAAVAEVFGNLHVWTEEMFQFDSTNPAFGGAVRALVTYKIPDELSTLDLDHALALHERGMKPTSVVERNRSATQTWALRIFRERNNAGKAKWQGVEWWSFHRPHWKVLGLWGITPQFHKLEVLSLSHDAVVDASETLGKVTS